MRAGIGYDSHRFIEGRKLILGGIDIPFKKGLAGHSDGDVLCHAIIDSILGALGCGDIGLHFPDTDARWKDASSIMLLDRIVRMAGSMGFEIIWLDTIIIAESPRIAPYLASMKEAIASAGIPLSIISIKAKTNEGMGFIGRGEGIAAQSICLVRKSPQ